jgi:hypothetical protein
MGFEGDTYRLEGSTDLQNWRLVSTNLFSGQAEVIPRTNAPGANALFFRAAVEER